MMIRAALAIILMLIAAGSSPVVAAELPEMIIRNVMILVPGSKTEVSSVDIQIKKGRVALNSEDRIHAEAGGSGAHS
jgi:hypothetical protein